MQSLYDIESAMFLIIAAKYENSVIVEQTR